MVEVLVRVIGKCRPLIGARELKSVSTVAKSQREKYFKLVMHPGLRKL